MRYNVVLTFEPVDEILKFDLNHWIDATMVLFMMLYGGVNRFEFMPDKILSVKV